MRALSLWQALWFVVACYVCPILADVSILTPLNGNTYSASSGTAQIEISWENDGKSPGLDEIQKFEFLICMGPNENIYCPTTLASVEPSAVTGNKYTLKVPNTVGANGAYYIQLYARLENGHSISYSRRFMLTGMVGSSPAGNDASIPPPDHELNYKVNSESFSIPYTEQTGRTRFAPMQLQPGTSVTAKTWTIRFPTSSVSYFSTIDSGLQQLSTITPGWSYTFTSFANRATPAPMPSDNGSWYNPRKKLSASPRKVNFKRAVGIPTPTVVNESL